MYSGRVRALLDERGKTVKKAGPAIPVQILGFQGVPMAGDQLLVVEDAAAAREVAQRRERLDREAKSRRGTRGGVTLEDFMAQAAAGVAHTLNIVIKADQGGPAEALADALIGLSTPEVKVEVIHRGVGAITESDILLARTAGAIIIGFHVRPDNNARTAAEREGVEIKLYRIIYEAVADVRAAMEGMLRPEEREVVLGEAEVREVFKISRIGTIAGCSVRSGVINRQGRVRVVRDGVEVFDGTISSLKRFKDDVREVREGFECGIGVENFNDLKVGDVIECYRTEAVARTLDSTRRRLSAPMPPDNRRADRVAAGIREEVATFLAEDVKDPRITGLVTVTGVEVTRDLRHAKVFVSVMGTDAERAATFEGLASVAGHLRRASGAPFGCVSRPRSRSGPTRASRARRASRTCLRRSRTASRPRTAGMATPTTEASGLLLVDKPAGITSHDVVADRSPRAADAPRRPRRHARPICHRPARRAIWSRNATNSVHRRRAEGLRGDHSASAPRPTPTIAPAS